MMLSKIQSLLIFIVVFASVSYNFFIDEDQSKLILGMILAPIKPYYDNYFQLFTPEELKLFNGSNNRPMYLAILGSVFDVTKGSKHYSPGSSYHGFVGKDATRAFITGDFTPEGLTSNIDGLEPSDLMSLHKWLQHYLKEYTFKGHLIGVFYDEFGYPTEYMRQFTNKVAEAEQLVSKEASLNEKYPPCNYEWNQDTGSVVWCSPRSGGVTRKWSGVPRKMYEVGSTKHRCVCIKPESKEFSAGNFQVYENCDPQAERCVVKS